MAINFSQQFLPAAKSLGLYQSLFILFLLYYNLPILLLSLFWAIRNFLGDSFGLFHGLGRPHRPRVLQEEQRVEHGENGAADGDGVGRVVPEAGYLN